jgi:ribonuclease HII
VLYPEYGFKQHAGYGTKAHLEGILEHGITQWHRSTYGRCKEARLNPVLQDTLVITTEN